MALEHARLRALVERDMATAERLHSDDYHLISPGGRDHTKRSYLEDVASGQLEYTAFEPVTPISVRAGTDLVILRYQALIRLSVGDPAAPEEVSFTAWHTDHYERRDGAWQVVWSQATRLA